MWFINNDHLLVCVNTVFFCSLAHSKFHKDKNIEPFLRAVDKWGPGASCINLAYAQKLCVRQLSRSRSDVLTVKLTRECAFLHANFMSGVRTFLIVFVRWRLLQAMKWSCKHYTTNCSTSLSHHQPWEALLLICNL